MHLSASQLINWADCGERFRLERVVGIPELPAFWNIGGSTVHQTFDDIVQQGLGTHGAQASFAKHWLAEIAEAEAIEPDQSQWRRGGRASKANPNKEDGEWWIRNGLEMVKRFAVTYNTPFLPGVVVEDNGRKLTEVEFNVNIGMHSIKGYIDAVVELTDGSFVPRDYKAGSREPKSALQLGVYAHAMRQLYNVQVSAGEYLMTRNNVIINRGVGAYDEATLIRLFDKLALAKQHEIYIPNPGILCGTCSVAAHCKFGPEQ